jgi:RHS repeat-associated protein
VFGERRSYTGNADQSFAFTGEQVDNELGLVYLRARYYDPRMGRFLSSDYFPGFTRDTQSTNSYAYAQNNPVIYKDPDGEFVMTALAAGAIAYTGYKAVDAWKDFLDNARQTEENLSGYYEFDFEDPEWQAQYADYNPGKDIATTARSGAYAALQTPGTSVTGPPPTSLDWTVPAEFVLGELLLPDFKKPSPNRVRPVGARRGSSRQQVKGVSESQSVVGGTYTASWSTPPSQGK